MDKSNEDALGETKPLPFFLERKKRHDKKAVEVRVVLCAAFTTTTTTTCEYMSRESSSTIQTKRFACSLSWRVSSFRVRAARTPSRPSGPTFWDCFPTRRISRLSRLLFVCF